MREDVVWKKTEKERKEFLDKLKIAISVAGGVADNRWDNRPLDEVFSSLLTNGIEITFHLTKHYPHPMEYDQKIRAFQESEYENVVEFLYSERTKIDEDETEHILGD